MAPISSASSSGDVLPRLHNGYKSSNSNKSCSSNGVYVIQGEISLVVAAMRRVARWASMPHHEEEDHLIQGLMMMRQHLSTLSSLSEVDIVAMVSPFLEVITCETTAGPVTGVALSAMNKFLSYGLVDPRSPTSAKGINVIGRAVTHAKFPGTESSSDEVVLMKILQVLRLILLMPVGVYLTDTRVIEIMQTCFRICFQTGLSELLRRSAEQTLMDMIQLLFMRLNEFCEQEEPDDSMSSSMITHLYARGGNSEVTEAAGRDFEVGEPTSMTTEDGEIVYLEHSMVVQAKQVNNISSNHMYTNVAATPHTNDVGGSVTSSIHSTSITGGIIFGATGDNCKDTAAVSSMVEIKDTGSAIVEGKEIVAKVAAEVAASGVQFDASATASMEDGLDEETNSDGDIGQPYGLPCIRELFRFLISLINPDDSKNTNSMIRIGLSLINVAMETGSDSIVAHSSLLELVRDQLCRHLFRVARFDNLTLITLNLRAFFLIFESARDHLKIQQEMFLTFLMDRASDKNVSYEQQEACLDCVLQFCRLPMLVVELYLNYDCDMHCSNLFERLVKFISKNAFPTSGALYSTHLLSLDSVLAIVDAVEIRCRRRGAFMPQSPTLDDGNATWATLVPAPADISAVKLRKQLLLTGARKFNEKPSEGLTFLQENNLLKESADPVEVAAFLRTSPALTKAAVGEFIGGPSNTAFLEAYMSSFDFSFMRIDEALREFLEAFRLPGEAQVISRILERFAERYYTFVSTAREEESPRVIESGSNGGGVVSSHRCFFDQLCSVDATFVMAYAIIMLNVDQHSPNVRKRMVLADFVRNQRGLKGGEDYSPTFLQCIFEAIQRREIIMPDEHEGELSENYRWLVTLRRSSRATYARVESGAYDHNLFLLLWGPAIAAISAVFDTAKDDAVVHKAIAGFRKCATISAHYHMCDVFDNLIVSLSKYTSLLSPRGGARGTGGNGSSGGQLLGSAGGGNAGGEAGGVSEANAVAVAFGNDYKAQLTTVTMFQLTREHGNILREGWKNILDCMLTLYRAHLLPVDMTETEDFLSPSGKTSISAPRTRVEPARETSMLSTLSRYLLLGSSTSDGGADSVLSPQDAAARERTSLLVHECAPEDLFAESKFLEAESLIYLVKALVFASQGPAMHHSLDSHYDEEAAIFFLELMVDITLRNKDRVSFLWDIIYDHLAGLVSTTNSYSRLAERVVVALLRLSMRLLHYESVSSRVMDALSLLLDLHASVATGVLRQMIAGLHSLVLANTGYLHSESDWRTVFLLLRSAKSSPDASKIACDALSFIVYDTTSITSVNFGFCLEALNDIATTSLVSGVPSALVAGSVGTLSDNGDSSSAVHDLVTVDSGASDVGSSSSNDGQQQQQIGSPSASSRGLTLIQQQQLQRQADPVPLRALDMMYELRTRALAVASAVCLPPRGSGGIERVWHSFWSPSLKSMTLLCSDNRRIVRHAALTCLQRSLLMADLNQMAAAEWRSCFDDVLFPMLQRLMQHVHAAGLEETRMRTCNLLCKVFLQNLNALLSLDDFVDLWLRILDHMDRCMNVGNSDLLLEAIPESLKNMLLVMSTQGILSEPKLGSSSSGELWHLTWLRINQFLPILQEEVFPGSSPISTTSAPNDMPESSNPPEVVSEVTSSAYKSSLPESFQVAHFAPIAVPNTLSTGSGDSSTTTCLPSSEPLNA